MLQILSEIVYSLELMQYSNMKKSSLNWVPIFCLMLLAGTIFSPSFLKAQSNLTINGGHNLSVQLCGNQTMLAWGNNTGGALGLSTTGTYNGGVNSTATISTPTNVPFPSGITIAQVNAGSGGHILALDCNGNVWSWGANDNGQGGVGNFAAINSVPMYVKAGVGPSGTGTATGAVGGNANVLTGVSQVVGGNVTSFAIMKNGDLLAWGCDAGCYPGYTGALGDGGATNRNTPVYVKNGLTNANLTGVLSVSAGDNEALALVDDGSGLGTGTVYSWGNGLTVVNGRYQYLARPSTQNAGLAMPVLKGDGTPLDNIIAISAGDVFSLALDADGYVWAWGDGGWAGATGQGTQQAIAIPAKVLAGATAGTNGSDGTYLLAQSIGAGQNFGMAITADGKPVAWGGNSPLPPAGGTGGSLGNNGGPGTCGGAAKTDMSCTPVYIQNPAGGVDDDVIEVDRGDLWGFYRRADGSIYEWGYNGEGELGDGGTANALRSKKFTSTCTILDPAPKVDVTPGDTVICYDANFPTPGIKISSGFVIAASLYSHYNIVWSRNGTQISSGFVTAANLNYTAKDTGTYTVTVTAVGNIPCLGFPPAVGKVHITAFKPTFTAPNNLTYCGTKSVVHVTPNTPALNAKYNWYPTLASNTILGTTIGSGTDTIDVTTATAGTGSDKIVYVEEKNNSSGIVAPISGTTGSNSQSANNVAGTGVLGSGADMYFVAYQNITLDTLSIVATSNSGSTQTGVTFRLQVFSTTQSCGGKLVANRAKVLYSGPTLTTSVNATATTIKIPMGVTVAGSASGNSYFIGLTSNFTGNINLYTAGGMPYTGNDLSVSNTPKVDNVTGKIIEVYGSDQSDCYPNANTFGAFVNWKFSTAETYCNRVPVTIKQLCPCNAPATVVMTSTGPAQTGSPKKVTVCANASPFPTFSGTYTKGTGTNTNNYFYSWFKKGTLNPVYHDLSSTGVVAIPNLTPALTAADSGVWYLRVEDYNGSVISGCYKQDSIHLIVNKLPNVRTWDTTVCAPATADLTIRWKDMNNLTGTNVIYHNGSTAASPTITVAAAKAIAVAGPYYVEVVNGLCSVGGVINVTISPKPKPAIAISPNKTSFCVGDAYTLTASTAVTGTPTYAWSLDGSAAVAAQAGKTTAGNWKYLVTLKLNGCTDTLSQRITVNALPTASITGGSKLCAGATSSLTLTLTGATPFKVDYTDFSGAAQSTTTSSIAVGGTDVGTYTLTKVTDANGCFATTFPSPLSASTTVSRFPALVTANPKAVCNFATKMATVTFDVTSGTPTYTFAPTGSFTTPTFSATFLADGTGGSTPYKYVVDDASGCAANKGIVAVNSSINCACPVTGVIANASGKLAGDSICNDGTTTTNITVTVAGSNQPSPVYAFTITTPTGTLTEAQATSVVGNVYTFAVKDPGKYTIQSVGDKVQPPGCMGSGTGQAIVSNFPDPTAKLKATIPNFCKGVSAGEVTINITPTKGPYKVLVHRSNSGDTTLTNIPTATAVFSSKKDDTFTLGTLQDGNGCLAKTSGLTNDPQNSTKGVTPPTASLTDPVPVVSGASGSYTFNAVSEAVTAGTVATGYTGVWSIASTSGSGKAALKTTSSALTDSVTLMDYDDVATVSWTVHDDNNICPTPAVAKVVLTRKNITEAKAINDTICVSLGHYTQQAGSKPTSPEVAAWTPSPSFPTSPAPGGIDPTILDVNFTTAGTYGYRYTITNPNVLVAGTPISSSKDITILVEDVATTADADTTAAPGATVQVCGSPYALKANTPNYVNGERGDWKGTGVTFTPNNTSHVDSISGLVDGSSYLLTWTIYTKYGKCPAKTDQITYLKLKDITKPTLASVSDLCTNSATGVSLVATAANGGNNESGVWTSSPAIAALNGSIDETPPAITGLKKGTYTVTWTITSSTCPGGNAVSRTFKVDSLPSVLSIGSLDPLCEGKTGTYTANGVSSQFAFPVTIQWSTSSNSSGAPVVTTSGSTSASPITYTFTSSPAYIDQKDSATVKLTVTNSQCGSVSLTHPVIWQLTPRTVGTISPGGICRSATGYYPFGTTLQPNTSTYTWTFGSIIPIGDTTRFPLIGTDTVYIGPSRWASLGTSATLQLVLSNTCGTGASTSIQVPIQTPANLSVGLGTDKVNNDFCLPLDQVLFTASAATSPALAFPVAGTYTFYLNDTLTVPLGTSVTLPSTYTAPQGTLSNSDRVWVKFHADTFQCLVNTRAAAFQKVFAYNYPDSVLIVSQPAICNDEPPITLTLKTDSNSSGVIDWYKNVGGVPQIQPQYHNQNSITVGSRSESGAYSVRVKGNVCSTHISASDTAQVRVYDRPAPFFGVDPIGIISYPTPFVISYDDKSPGIYMPFGGTGTNDTIHGVTYTQVPVGYDWLNKYDILNPIIKTTKEEATVDYTVTMYTGDSLHNGYKCYNRASIKVINTLPLLIPNAFSPNGDGKNEVWVIDGLGKYPNTQVKVYNRWGNAMYTDSYGYRVPWDGTHNGALLATGTYYYIIDLKGSPDGTDGQRSGSLTIVR